MKVDVLKLFISSHLLSQVCTELGLVRLRVLHMLEEHWVVVVKQISA